MNRDLAGRERAHRPRVVPVARRVAPRPPHAARGSRYGDGRRALRESGGRRTTFPDRNCCPAMRPLHPDRRRRPVASLGKGGADVRSDGGPFVLDGQNHQTPLCDVSHDLHPRGGWSRRFGPRREGLESPTECLPQRVYSWAVHLPPLLQQRCRRSGQSPCRDAPTSLQLAWR